MRHPAVRLSVAALALVLLAGSAFAASEAPVKKRKLGFFESLFGERSVRHERKRQPAFGRNWWSRGDDDVRIVYGSDWGPDGTKNRRRVVADDDPEGDPGFGMGNISYVADKQVPLGGNVLAVPRPEGDAGLIYDALSDRDLGIRTLPAARDAIVQHYRTTGFRPIWLAAGKLSDRGRNLLHTLAAADAEGLESARYLPPVLQAFDQPLPETDPTAMARLDLGLTAAAVRYARDASGGQFDPRRLSLYNDITPQWVTPSQALKVLAWSPFPVEYLTSLHPKHPAYAAMKTELAALRQAGPPEPVVPIEQGKLVKPGQSDERLPAVRARLAQRGFPLPSDEVVLDETILDDELSNRLKDFQKSAGVKNTGLLGNKTIEALNRNQNIDRIPQLLDNLERLRWLPKSLGKRYVFVNQPAFEVRVMDGSEEVWRSRVIVGKPMTQTAVFHDEIEMVVFNPSWGVPQSIIANEYLPKLRDDPGYLDRLGFKVVDARGRVVPSEAVDWWAYGSKVPYGIQQPPGSDNALGELKFLFPNSHDIYMHDTPNRELFERQVRAFSHGCVRVQNPREFAQILLGWDSAKVDANTDSGKSQTVKLAAKVPVHIAYFTAWPDETGKIQYFNDIYGRDKAMETARTTVTLAQR